MLRDDPEFSFEILIDVCGVDYLGYGESEWETRGATDSGFSRGVEREVIIPDADTKFDARRFAVVYHLLSIRNNQRCAAACLYRPGQSSSDTVSC